MLTCFVVEEQRQKVTDKCGPIEDFHYNLSNWTFEAYNKSDSRLQGLLTIFFYDKNLSRALFKKVVLQIFFFLDYYLIVKL